VTGHPAGSRREVLADRLKDAWFEGHKGRPIADGWLYVADAALAEPVDLPPHETEAHDEPIPEWDMDVVAVESDTEPLVARDHVYSINVIYPDGSEAFERGHATAGQLSQRLRFEANLCSPERGESGHGLPSPDHFVDGAPSWRLPDLDDGLLPATLTAWNNGVQTASGALIEDLDSLEMAARQILAAVTQVRGWRIG